MSQQATSGNDNTDFHTELGIPLLTIPNAKEACKLTWKAGQIPCLVGVAGIGKSEALKQCAKELSIAEGVTYGCRSLFAPLLPPEKIQGLPFRSQENPNTVKTLIDEELWNTVHAHEQGVLIIDEINRADDDTLKALFVLMSERRTGIFELPPGWVLACAMNPTGADYKVNDITSDPAMRRRLVFLGMQPDTKIWLDYAIKAGFHPAVINFISATPDLLLDTRTRAAGKVYANPAGWEKVSKYLYSAGEEQRTDSWYSILKYATGGTVGTNTASEFVDFVKDEDLLMLPIDVIEHYAKPSSKISEKVGLALEGKGDAASRHDKVVALIRGVAIQILSAQPALDSSLSGNFSAFFNDLPEELRQLFSSEVTTRAESGTEADRKYLAAFTKHMGRNRIFIKATKELLQGHKEIQKKT